MQPQSRTGSRKIWSWVMIAGILAALIFWLEWLGSEQEQAPVEEAVMLPEGSGDTERK